ncbi:Phosphatidate cytidylyltransferase [Candidatus Zixiibacteriota bacterium]|nr:Phosphatidate cytidylyltransferase [candidate division Zixibacteria bacterium]
MPHQGGNHIAFKGELLRKLTHLFALVIPGGYYFLGLSKGQALAIMIPITAAMIIVDIGRLRNWRLWHYLKGILSPIIREHEMMGDFTGASYILATSCLAIGLFSKPVALAALAYIMVGDPASAIIGRRFGRVRFRTKSLEGSLAFLAAASVVALINPHLPLSVAYIGAVVATVTEAISFNVDDNASVPLVSGLVMQLMMSAIYW